MKIKKYVKNNREHKFCAEMRGVGLFLGGRVAKTCSQVGVLLLKNRGVKHTAPALEMI